MGKILNYKLLGTALKSLSDACFKADEQQKNGEKVTACGMSDDDLDRLCDIIPDMLNPMLSTEEVKEKLHVSDATLNRMVARGDLPNGECHFDEEMADIHLCLINQLHTKDVAKDYWHEVNNDNITINDWCVLWGEMVKRNNEKIKKWFPKINALDYERKIFDECISFLNNGGLPYHDLKV